MKLSSKSLVIPCSILVIALLFFAASKVEPVATSVILQSKDGGQTWEDISYGLPANSQAEDFLAGESEEYMRVKNVMYSRKRGLKTPVWERNNDLDSAGVRAAFNRSGARTYGDPIFPTVPSGEGAWLPVYTNSGKQSMRSVFETADGSITLGYRYGLYRSVDNGKSWERIPKDSGFGQLLSSKGVSAIGVNKVGNYLLSGHPDGIFLSSDMGKTWNRVHSGLDEEKIFSIHISGNIVYAVAWSRKGC